VGRNPLFKIYRTRKKNKYGRSKKKCGSSGASHRYIPIHIYYYIYTKATVIALLSFTCTCVRLIENNTSLLKTVDTSPSTHTHTHITSTPMGAINLLFLPIYQLSRTVSPPLQYLCLSVYPKTVTLVLLHVNVRAPYTPTKR